MKKKKEIHPVWDVKPSQGTMHTQCTVYYSFFTCGILFATNGHKSTFLFYILTYIYTFIAWPLLELIYVTVNSELTCIIMAMALT